MDMFWEKLHGFETFGGVLLAVIACMYLFDRLWPSKTEAEKDAEFARMTDEEKAEEQSRNVF